MKSKLLCKMLFVLLLLIPAKLFSQLVPVNQETSIDSSKKSGALNLYLNCQYCFEEYIKTEIKFVNYVRDRKEADVDLLLTSQITGSGGTEYTLTFTGQGNFAGMNDTLKYIANSTNTEDNTRQGLVQIIKIGLMQFVAKTNFASQIVISTKEQNETGEGGNPKNDKWKSWVFELSGNGYFNGQKSTSSTNLYGYVSANKTTEQWKINLSVNAEYNEQKYDFEDGVLKSNSRGKSFDGKVVYSLSDHWSTGILFNLGSSTYSNKKVYSKAAPGIEYNIFPYSQSTRKQLRMGYYFGYYHYNYEKTTIFEKDREDLFRQVVDVGLDVTQPWGSANLSLTGSAYIHDFTKNNFSVSGTINLRIIKGLSFRIYGYYEIRHDQLALPKEGATEEEILLQRKELATSYSYFISTGITFQFGSIYNNVVNTRFGN